MKQDTSPVLSLSFVDVFANSFACLLVLFFLMVAVRGHLEWSHPAGRGGNSGAGQGAPVNPFLVLVKIPPGPLRVSLDVEIWEIENAGDFLASPRTQTTIGADYAVLYAEQPPLSGAILRLRLPQSHPAGTVQVYQGGRALQQQTFSANVESVTIRTGGGPP